MGLFDGLLGNASQHSNEEVEKELINILIPNEAVTKAFQFQEGKKIIAI